MADGWLSKYGDQAKAVTAIFGVVALVGGGGKWVYDRIEGLKDAIEDVQSLKGDIAKLQSRLETLEAKVPANQLDQEKTLRTVVDATRDRFLVDERAAAELRGTVVALITEVRVRHGQPGYLPMPSMQPRGGGTYGEDDGAERGRLSAQIKQNKLAAEALDMSLGRTIEAIPQKAPLVGLDL